MYALIGLVILAISCDASKGKAPENDVIWYPIEDYKDGYVSSKGEVYLDPNRNDWSNLNNWQVNNRKYRAVSGGGSNIVFPSAEPEAPDESRMEECERNCPRTFEYNLVCGTDFVSYHNPSALKCAQLCGREVRFAHYGVCRNGLPLIFKPTPRAPRRNLFDDVTRNNW